MKLFLYKFKYVDIQNHLYVVESILFCNYKEFKDWQEQKVLENKNFYDFFEVVSCEVKETPLVIPAFVSVLD